MKKNFHILILLSILLLTLCTGCGVGSDISKEKLKGKEVVIVPEKMYIVQVNNIYNNFSQYKNKVIKIVGMYSDEYPGIEATKFKSAVYRKSPGCCGNDGITGFILDYNGKTPRKNKWIEVYGIPKKGYDHGYKYVYLDVINLKTTASETPFVEK